MSTVMNLGDFPVPTEQLSESQECLCPTVFVVARTFHPPNAAVSLVSLFR